MKKKLINLVHLPPFSVIRHIFLPVTRKPGMFIVYKYFKAILKLPVFDFFQMSSTVRKK